MEEGITEVERNLGDKALEANAHKMKGLGFGWIIMRCSFSKKIQCNNYQIPLHLALPLHSERRYHYQTTKRYSTIIYLISIIH
jgi:hypothetical protein